jgi:hypothetical protein
VHTRRQREWEVDREKVEDLERERQRQRARKGRDRGGEGEGERESERAKRYPGVSEDDDREESISLWDRSRLDDDDSVEGTSPRKWPDIF